MPSSNQGNECENHNSFSTCLMNILVTHEHVNRTRKSVDTSNTLFLLQNQSYPSSGESVFRTRLHLFKLRGVCLLALWVNSEATLLPVVVFLLADNT